MCVTTHLKRFSHLAMSTILHRSKDLAVAPSCCHEIHPSCDGAFAFRLRRHCSHLVDCPDGGYPLPFCKINFAGVRTFLIHPKMNAVVYTTVYIIPYRMNVDNKHKIPLFKGGFCVSNTYTISHTPPAHANSFLRSVSFCFSYVMIFE